MELSRNLDRQTQLLRKRETLSTEISDGPDAATIRFQLPSGAKVVRRFHREDKVQKVYDYLDVYFADNDDSVVNVAVSTHFPKVSS